VIVVDLLCFDVLYCVDEEGLFGLCGCGGFEVRQSESVV
jgi:hypothetical protein